MFGKKKKQSLFEKLTGSVSLDEDYDAFEDDFKPQVNTAPAKKLAVSEHDEPLPPDLDADEPEEEKLANQAGLRIRVVDLPGTYSLTAHSIEELVARNFVIDERPNVVIDIIDASNLERNLYLAVQFLELDTPLVLAFNMSDLAESRGYRIDHEHLSRLLGVPIAPTVAMGGGRSTCGVWVVI